MSSATVRAGQVVKRRLRDHLGGALRMRVILTLAAVLGLSGADTATVGASAAPLSSGLGLSNTQIGSLVSVTSLVAGVATLPFGVLADRVKRRTLVLAVAVALWALAMIWSAAVSDFRELLVARSFLGVVTAAAGPLIASLVGDYFPAAERGRIYSYILAGEMIGAGFGFLVTGDAAALSWRAAFLALVAPAVILAWFVFALPEPKRGGQAPLSPEGDGQGREESLGERSLPAGEEGGSSHDRTPKEMALGISLAEYRQAVLFVLSVPTNIRLIVASAAGYYFIAGLETFGLKFVQAQYRIDRAEANLMLLFVGIGAIGGILAAGAIGDRLVRRGVVSARIIVAAASVTAAVGLFIPALFTRSAAWAALFLIFALFMLLAQNPPIDAARLDVMPPRLRGRAESIRTALRSIAQAFGPVLFGLVSEDVFSGGRSGLRWTFAVMLGPLIVSALVLWSARHTYPSDVARAESEAQRDVGAQELA